MNNKFSGVFILILILIGAYFIFGGQFNLQKEKSSVDFLAYTNESGEQWTIPQGRSVYEISNDPNKWPKFIKAEIDPLQVYPGETQYMKVVLENDNPIESVTAHVETDNGVREIEMNKVSSEEVTREDIENRKYLVAEDGTLIVNNKSTPEKILSSVKNYLVNKAIAQETKQYTYEADWVVEDTHETTYITEFGAVDSEGRESVHSMAWSDPWNGLRDYGTGNDSIADGGTVPHTVDSGSLAKGVRGLEAGNIDFSGDYNITVQDNTYFVWNPGYSITLNNGGSFTIQSGGEMRSGYIYLADGDTDSSGVEMTKKYLYEWFACPDGSNGDSTFSPFGDGCQVKCSADADDTCISPPSNLRRANSVNSVDCADGDSNTYPGQTSWFETSGGNGFDYNCDGTEEHRWPYSTACLKNSSQPEDAYASDPGCGNSGTLYLTDCSTRTQTQQCR